MGASPGPALVGRRLVRLATVASTNDYLRERLGEGLEEGFAVVADRQVAGRGRHGRPWASPAGGLYLSVLLRPPPPRAPLLTLLAALAPLRACAALGFPLQVKWPNDLVAGEAKVGGILGEGVHHGGGYHLILGLGLNADVPAERLPLLEEGRATSLRVLGGRPVDNGALLEGILRELDDLYRRFREGGAGELLAHYRRACITLGRRVEARTPRERIVGLAVDVSPEGFLLVEAEGGGLRALPEATVRPLP